MNTKLRRGPFDEIRRAKKRRIMVILKSLQNSDEHISPTPIISAIIDRNLNSYIKAHYNIATLAGLPESEVESCITLIRQYRFLYFDKYYG